MRDEVRYRKEQQAEIDGLRAAYPWLSPLGCHAGWVGLLGTLCRKLDAVLGARSLRGGGGTSLQVACKEKFGRLGVSVFGIPEHKRDAIDALVRAAAAESERVCEVCGAAGNTRTHGVYRTTRCGRHHAQFREDHADRA